MNKELLQDWVTALRSGKYNQGTEFLRRTVDEEDCYCATGVLCDISGVGEWRKRRDGTYSYVAVDEGGLPIGNSSMFSVPNKLQDMFLENRVSIYSTDLMEIIKCSIDGDEFEKIIELTGSMYGEVSIEYLNDNGWSFDELADLLEQDFEWFVSS